jgi:hypothetical protein
MHAASDSVARHRSQATPSFVPVKSRHSPERARSRLGESRYRLLTNNCEHFCSWALRDECERLRALQRMVWT